MLDQESSRWNRFTNWISQTTTAQRVMFGVGCLVATAVLVVAAPIVGKFLLGAALYKTVTATAAMAKTVIVSGATYVGTLLPEIKNKVSEWWHGKPAEKPAPAPQQQEQKQEQSQEQEQRQQVVVNNYMSPQSAPVIKHETGTQTEPDLSISVDQQTPFSPVTRNLNFDSSHSESKHYASPISQPRKRETVDGYIQTYINENEELGKQARKQIQGIFAIIAYDPLKNKVNTAAGAAKEQREYIRNNSMPVNLPQEAFIPDIDQLTKNTNNYLLNGYFFNPIKNSLDKSHFLETLVIEKNDRKRFNQGLDNYFQILLKNKSEREKLEIKFKKLIAPQSTHPIVKADYQEFQASPSKIIPTPLRRAAIKDARKAPTPRKLRF